VIGDRWHIFLEPHFDDAALSCGGTIARLVDAGADVLVVTVFGGKPEDESVLGAFARIQHARWRLGDAVEERLREHRSAMAVLGCAHRVLPFPDAIYRGALYQSEDALFGQVSSDECPLIGQISRILEELHGERPRVRFYAPLTVGHHVDHQIALAALPSAAETSLYEDFPYAAREARAVADATARVGAVHERDVPVGATLARRIDAIRCYASQMGTLFGSTDRMERTVAEYAGRTGEPIERYWCRGVPPDL